MAVDVARLQFELRREGRHLGWHDLEMAATALAANEALVPSDAGFTSVQGLDMESR